MKVYQKLLLLGALAYAIFLVTVIPARLVFDRLASYGVKASAVEGSIWNGRARGMQVGVLTLGDVAWQLKFFPLFTGRLLADTQLMRSDGSAKAAVSASFSGRVVLSRVSADLPIDAIVGSGGLPGGWRGKIKAQMPEVALENGWPVAAKGTIEVVDLTGPAQQPADIGSYRLTFPGGNTSDKTVVGKLEDLQAAIAANGELKLSPGRAYVLDVHVAARPNAPESLKQGMQYLGAPDAQGRRPFSVSGTL
jgi:general secretion pathway protein N